MKLSEYEDLIRKFLPDHCADIVTRWMYDGKIHLRISKGRMTKLGDYRPPQRGQGHKISINNNLNPYHFLIILGHEYAHYCTWTEYEHKVKPHGAEWKLNFKEVMQPFFERKVFPDTLAKVLHAYLQNPASNTRASKELDRELANYDSHKSPELSKVEDFEKDDVFVLSNGKVFQMKEKKRTRYRCLCLNDGREYAVSGLADARLLSEEERKKLSRGFLRSLFR